MEGMPFSMEPRVRALGVPSVLRDGKVICLADYTVCTEGEPVNVEQAKLLVRLSLDIFPPHLFPETPREKDGRVPHARCCLLRSRR